MFQFLEIHFQTQIIFKRIGSFRIHFSLFNTNKVKNLNKQPSFEKRCLLMSSAAPRARPDQTTSPTPPI